MKRLLFLFLIFVSAYGFATHNRAGELLYKRIAPFTQTLNNLTVQVYTYSITLIKYTDHGPQVADRCVDTIYFGDGQRGVAQRINGGTGLCQDCPQCGTLIINEPSGYKVKKNIYTIIHTYSGSGSYLIRTFDPNRNAGIINMSNSVNQPFYLESLLIINNFSGANSSPEFNFPPIDRACFDKCFYHNPGAFDSDGDSLSYEISTSRGANGQTVAGYSFPYAGVGGTYGIDATTGKLTWCKPQAQGEYNLAFIVKEWRKNTSGVYQIIGYVLRDMQVVVGSCPNNDPPTVTVPIDTCVQAGAQITKTIIYGDININTVTLQGNGGAFAGPTPLATLSNTSYAVTSTLTPTTAATFFWQTACSHIRLQPYQTVFKVEDSGAPTVPAIKLVNFATYNIRVVPPAVQNVTAVPIGSTMKISWTLSTCNPTNNPITAYKIYRKNDCSPFVYDPCQRGISPSSGFDSVGQTINTATVFIDNNGGNGLVVGQDYSYLVIAIYKDGSQSFGSSQVCAKLKRDIPVLLNVDILSTSVSSGSVYVRWTRPLVNVGNFDTLVLPGPYQFNLKHRYNSTDTYTTIFNTSSPYFFKPDTQFVHSNINTDATSQDYIVEFVAGTTTVGASQRATSIFLTATPGDRKINLKWSSATPWNNYNYTVYRKNPSQTTFSAIATTSLTSYTDTSKVANRYSYCYKILGTGQYSDPSIFKPLLNNSQEVCATAVDLTPPCSPTLSIVADCPTGMVQISWTDVRPICSDDVIKYILFYKPTIDEVYQQVATFASSVTTFNYDGLELISGCYAVQSVDSSNNVSPLSFDFCIDNCPIFELPNIVTLNGDGVNDFFKAIRVRQIKEIDLVIFDRWGNLVYQTKDPYFKWDGTSMQSNLLVSEGTFFYICDVFEPRLKGIVKRNLKGFMQVVK
ncbi:gliding motility-associated C-terminal domain-containing protein [Sediminibacterium sp.]|uniref:gliding motility-associated C-terminal domain-containing protein n=1 Tax=Sediminibacterium sp. TaxID=1917865 RepID=UPI0027356C95|nr:gliding motility-associated C-terminal domain-containing protein [Sediminibacterium sp.]MDP3567529.1 gliding motility-associated C-terminal domain-containing protein [Sediminibacterium sp.]